MMKKIATKSIAVWFFPDSTVTGTVYRIGFMVNRTESLRANHLVSIGTPGDVVLFVIYKFVDNSKLLKILVSLGVLILHFIIMIAFYEMPEFERITDPYQPELADRSYNLTFCLSDYQEHSFDSCPGKRLAGQSDMEYSLVVRPVCKICYRGPTVWVGCTYQIPSVIGQGKVLISQLLTAHCTHQKD